MNEVVGSVLQAEGRACVKAQRPGHGTGGLLIGLGVVRAQTLGMEAGVTPISVKVADLTLGQWKAMESVQQGRGVIRSGLESSLWLERGEMIGGRDTEVTADWPEE